MHFLRGPELLNSSPRYNEQIATVRCLYLNGRNRNSKTQTSVTILILATGFLQSCVRCLAHIGRVQPNSSGVAGTNLASCKNFIDEDRFPAIGVKPSANFNVFADHVLAVDLSVAAAVFSRKAAGREARCRERRLCSNHDVCPCYVALASTKGEGNLGKHEVCIGAVKAVLQAAVARPKRRTAGARHRTNVIQGKKFSSGQLGLNSWKSSGLLTTALVNTLQQDQKTEPRVQRLPTLVHVLGTAHARDLAYRPNPPVR
jgi:hypothetical protein